MHEGFLRRELLVVLLMASADAVVAPGSAISPEAVPHTRPIHTIQCRPDPEGPWCITPECDLGGDVAKLVAASA